MEALKIIQSKLVCPKNQYNKFGQYHYRSCEDILEAVKPLLAEQGCVLKLGDNIVAPCEGWVFVEATAILTDSEGNSVTVSAYARHEAEKKGMDGSQVSGAASSYARKYALNGLFLIDDTKDADSTNTHGANNNTGKGQNAPQKATKADFERIKQARESAGLSKDDVIAIANQSPFFVGGDISSLLQKHVGELIDKIKENANQ